MNRTIRLVLLSAVVLSGLTAARGQPTRDSAIDHGATNPCTGGSIDDSTWIEVKPTGMIAPGLSSVPTSAATASEQIGHIFTSGDVTLSGGLAVSSPRVRLPTEKMKWCNSRGCSTFRAPNELHLHSRPDEAAYVF